MKVLCWLLVVILLAGCESTTAPFEEESFDGRFVIDIKGSYDAHIEGYAFMYELDMGEGNYFFELKLLPGYLYDPEGLRREAGLYAYSHWRGEPGVFALTDKFGPEGQVLIQELNGEYDLREGIVEIIEIQDYHLYGYIRATASPSDGSEGAVAINGTFSAWLQTM